MVVCLQYLDAGGLLAKTELTDYNYYIVWFVHFLCLAGVNCLVLCTGYFLNENLFKPARLIYFWIQIFVTNAIFAVLMGALGFYEFTPEQALAVLFPVTSNLYWYMTAYFILCIISPFLLWVVDKLGAKQLKSVCYTLVLLFAVIPWDWAKLNSARHFMWFVVLFFVSAYIKKADLFKKRVRVYIGRYLFLTLIALVIKLMFASMFNNSFITKAVDFSSLNFVFVFFASLMLFAAFKNIRIKNKKLGGAATFLSSLILGVYLFSYNIYFSDWFWGKGISPLDYINSPLLVLHMIGCVFAVFFISAFLEYFRMLVFKLLNVPSACDKLAHKAHEIGQKINKSNFIEKL